MDLLSYLHWAKMVTILLCFLGVDFIIFLMKINLPSLAKRNAVNVALSYPQNPINETLRFELELF